jgi:DNA or RNA helicases of superfamily II
MGHHRNLLVSATGTGKTVMAAVDYARLREKLPRARLLFVAHREEILQQSRATFAHAIRDGGFGELWVGGHRPTEFEHVFASIQSLNATALSALDPEHFDVVIIDEFHHAAADTYTRLLDLVRPRELLGLTATPERSDGLSILHWFDGRIAAELRLWDAIDQHRLTPFSYFGIAIH